MERERIVRAYRATAIRNNHGTDWKLYESIWNSFIDDVPHSLTTEEGEKRDA